MTYHSNTSNNLSLLLIDLLCHPLCLTFEEFLLQQVRLDTLLLTNSIKSLIEPRNCLILSLPIGPNALFQPLEHLVLLWRQLRLTILLLLLLRDSLLWNVPVITHLKHGGCIRAGKIRWHPLHSLLVFSFLYQCEILLFLVHFFWRLITNRTSLSPWISFFCFVYLWATQFFFFSYLWRI